jgi:hypothetical protein
VVQPAAPRALILLAVHLPADAAAVGLTAVPALVNNLHHRDATMYQLQVVVAVGTLTPLPVLAVNQPQHLAQELAVVPDRAPLDLIG